LSAVAEVDFPRTLPEIEIRSVVPVVRRAILIRHEPHLTWKQTEDAHAAVKSAWAKFSDAYRANVAKVTRTPKHLLAFDKSEKEIRHRVDGKTPMIDFPRLRTLPGAHLHFDQRSCVALCTDKYSSKVWTRVGPPKGDPGFHVGEIGERTEAYRRQADACGRWFDEEFFSITEPIFEHNRPIKTGILEIITVGLQVEGEPDEDYFSDWLLDGNRPNLHNADLRQFLAAAGNLKFDVRELDQKEPKSSWISIPNTVMLRNGDLASRRFLYLVRPVGDDHFVVGIGFDDSGRGELASDVALKLSRYIANRI
jgi:hypothetical protein